MAKTITKNENIDHIYCNKLNRRDNFIGDQKTVSRMKNFILTNLNLIEELQSQLHERDILIAKLLAENEGLKQRLQRHKYSKGSSKKIESNNNNNPNNNSISINSKEYVNGIPVISKKSNEKKSESFLKDKRVSIDTSEDEIFNKKPSEDSQESINVIKLSSKDLFMMTKKPYVINDWKICELEDEEIQKGFDDIHLEIPRWIECSLPTTPSHEIEFLPVEDVTDESFLKRHQKFEIEGKTLVAYFLKNNLFVHVFLF